MRAVIECGLQILVQCRIVKCQMLHTILLMPLRPFRALCNNDTAVVHRLSDPKEEGVKYEPGVKVKKVNLSVDY